MKEHKFSILDDYELRQYKDLSGFDKAYMGTMQVYDSHLNDMVVKHKVSLKWRLSIDKYNNN